MSSGVLPKTVNCSETVFGNRFSVKLYTQLCRSQVATCTHVFV